MERVVGRVRRSVFEEVAERGVFDFRGVVSWLAVLQEWYSQAAGRMSVMQARVIKDELA